MAKAKARKPKGALRYTVAEVVDGWRVFKNFGNEQPVGPVFRTEGAAQDKIGQLMKADERRTAIAELRAAAAGRCQCAGECGRQHDERCANTDGSTVVDLAATPVRLMAVAVNHNADDLRQKNLRLYCQLCRQFHDAQARNTDPLCDIAEFAHSAG